MQMLGVLLWLVLSRSAWEKVVERALSQLNFDVFVLEMAARTILNCLNVYPLTVHPYLSTAPPCERPKPLPCGWLTSLPCGSLALLLYGSLTLLLCGLLTPLPCGSLKPLLCGVLPPLSDVAPHA